ncbi:hypothetical protein MLD38_019462 [Melastoma candidum]|nr:hypothetical protein MLD38_019462 [Melastoma candidum]
MGCISSKVMARSASYRQEMKLGSSRGTARGTQALPGDLLIPKKGSHHFLALVCTATATADGHRSGSFTFESPISADKTGDDDATIVPHQVPLVNQDQSTDDHEASADPPKRSRSWHSFPLEDLPYASSAESCNEDNCTAEVNDKGAIQSRSFHTVEDYDRLLKRIWHATLSGKENGAEESAEREKEKLTSPIDTANQTKEDNANSQETKSSQGRASLVGESNASNVMMIKIARDDKEDPRSLKVNIQGELSINNDATQERPLPLTAKGFKRKSIARELNALKIPSTFEPPAVASLREWIPEGQVSSPDVDPTPKFGSFFVPSDNITNKSDQHAIFNDELVFALEEQLQHMKAEEEDILKQITSTWEVPGSTGIKEDIATS